jgi:glycosyltransferase involved in cell wall biosynthesis
VCNGKLSVSYAFVKKRPLRIAFVHPSLGLGGAERLVIDAAQVLTQLGHEVTIFTADFAAERAFDDIRNGELDVRVHGRLLPTGVGGRLKAPLTIARMGYVAWRAALAADFDVIFVDLIAQILPVLRSCTRARLIFYCHFPDKWLTPSRARWLYRMYRAPLDRAEARALEYADKVLVNSLFTKGMLERAFPSLSHSAHVLSPGVDVELYAPREPSRDREILLLSLARYAPSKNLGLAIAALPILRERLPAELFARVRLVQAGGLSVQTPGAQRTFDELSQQVEYHELGAQVCLETSISETRKLAYLQRARALLFTPENEHFGIVPVEAMACGVPVVAHASGGPLETIRHGETGFLCASEASSFADHLEVLVRSEALAAQMGAAAREDVVRRWSRRAFAEKLERSVLALAG